MIRLTLRSVTQLAAAGLWLIVSLTASAQTTDGSDTSNYGDFPPAPLTPDEIISQGVGRLGKFLSSEQAPSAAQIRDFLDAEIAEYFDFPYMTKWATGPYHRRLTEQQRSAVSRHLSETFLTALARNLGSFAVPAPIIEVFPASKGRTDNEVAVHTRVVLSSSFLVELEFRFYWSPVGWRIFDVAANGTSAVAYYRRYYTETLRRHGPDAFAS